MKIIDDFFEFENKYNLFDIEDKHGLKVWESIRYCIASQIIRPSTTSSQSKSRSFNSSFAFTLKRIWAFCVYILTHLNRRTLIILDSRSISNDFYCDTIFDDLISITNKRDVFFIETTYNWDKKNYKYGKVCPSLTTLFMRLCKSKYDFRDIISKIKKEFCGVELNCNEINCYYRLFVAQYIFYKFLFKILCVERVFFVQNGICKGLLAAAHNNSTKIIELQHGQISRNHVAYSYHQIMDTKSVNLYNPSYLLTFGPAWLNNASFPGVKIVPLGNSYYCCSGDMKNGGDKSVLVVSSIFHAEALKQLVRDIILIDMEFTFYFKLHPDEYKFYDEYKNYFVDCPNVIVIKNEQSIVELLSKVKLSLGVQSTVLVETLNAGRWAFVYRVMDYEVMDFLFDEPGVKMIDDARTFLNQYRAIGEKELPVGRYFMPFNSVTGKRMLQI